MDQPTSQPTSFQSQPTTLTGVVERITFTNPENGYTVARFKTDRYFGLVTLVGALVMMVITNPGLSLYIAVVVPLVLLPILVALAPAQLWAMRAASVS